MDAIQNNVSKTASKRASSFLAQEEEFLEVFQAISKKSKNKIEGLFNLRADNPDEYWDIWWVEVNSAKKQFPQGKFLQQFLLRTPKEF